MEEEQLISRVKTVLINTESISDSDVRMLYIFTRAVKSDILDYEYLKAKQAIINELIRRGFGEDIIDEQPKPVPNKNKLSLSRMIFGIFFFIIIAGTVVQCTQKTGKVLDVIFDHPED